MPRVVVYQGRPAGRLPARHLERIRAARPEFLCLPEYFWVPAGAASQRDAAAHAGAARKSLEDLSRRLDAAVVGGSYVVAEDGRLYNTAAVHDRGVLVGEQRKVHPTARERAAGIASGGDFAAFVAGGVRIGVMICADVLETKSFERMRQLDVALVFAPTLSPFIRGDTPEAKDRRDREIFAAGAVAAGAPVIKACGVGRIFGSRLQGRSLIADASGRLVARVPFDREGRVRVLAADL